MGQDRAWKQVEADWRDVVLVCRKCTKKLDGGFGPDGDEQFAKALRHALDDRGPKRLKMRRREVAVMEVGCLDICPKRAVVVVTGRDPKALMLVPERAGMAEVVERLGLRRGAGSRETDVIGPSRQGFDGDGADLRDRPGVAGQQGDAALSNGPCRVRGDPPCTDLS